MTFLKSEKIEGRVAFRPKLVHISTVKREAARLRALDKLRKRSKEPRAA